MFALLETKVCPTAPPAAQPLMNLFTGYILWGVVAFVVICFLVSLIFWLLGAGIRHHGLQQGGVVGMLIAVAAAMLYFVGMAVITFIFKDACVSVPTYGDTRMPGPVAQKPVEIHPPDVPSGNGPATPPQDPAPSSDPTIEPMPANPPAEPDPAPAPNDPGPCVDTRLLGQSRCHG